MNFTKWRYNAVDKSFDVHSLDFRWATHSLVGEVAMMQGALTIAGAHFTITMIMQTETTSVDAVSARGDSIATLSWNHAPGAYDGLAERCADALTAVCARLSPDVIVVSPTWTPADAPDAFTSPLF